MVLCVCLPGGEKRGKKAVIESVNTSECYLLNSQIPVKFMNSEQYEVKPKGGKIKNRGSTENKSQEDNLRTKTEEEEEAGARQ